MYRFNGRTAQPLEQLTPRMRRADIEVPNHAVDMDSWARSACYPRGTFYPLSDGASISHRRVTSSDFLSLLEMSLSQSSSLCTYTRNLIANQAEGTLSASVTF